jgi:hypothetical protein
MGLSYRRSSLSRDTDGGSDGWSHVALAADQESRRCQITKVKRTSRRSLYEFTFACDTLMRFVGALNAIFRLAAAWKLFDNLKNPAGYKPTDLWPDGNDISDLEFVGRHRFPRLPARITVSIHLNSIGVTLTERNPVRLTPHAESTMD